MKTQLVEIFPGMTIEVSGRLKKRAGFGTMPLKLNPLNDEERKRILGELVRENRRFQKYTTLLLDEAVSVSREVGVREAARITGVKARAIILRKTVLIKEGKYVPLASSREKIKQCADLAESLIGTEVVVQVRQKLSRFAAFMEAGKRMGINGRNIYYYSLKGIFGLTQHISKRKSASGSRARIAKPTAQ